MRASDIGLINKKLPSASLVKEAGLWWYPFGKLEQVQQLPMQHGMFRKWMSDDIENGWLAVYYNTNDKKLTRQYAVENDELSDQLKQELAHASQHVVNIADDTFQLKDALMLALAKRRFWEDEILGYETVDLGFEHLPQFCVDEAFFMKADFMIKLVEKYCPNWTYNSDLSNKQRLVLDRVCNDEFVWHIVLQAPKKFGFDTLQVVLAQQEKRVLHPKHIVFQLNFDNILLMHLWAGQHFSTWKVDINHRYLYIERYIDWIEPKVLDVIDTL